MKLVRQRGAADCGVAALAMVAGVSYERARKAFHAIDEAPGRDGVTNGDLIAAAAHLGVTLEAHRVRGTAAFEMANAVKSAVLRVRWTDARRLRNPGGHFVCIENGRVYCPSGMKENLVVYLENSARVCTVMVRVR